MKSLFFLPLLEIVPFMITLESILCKASLPLLLPYDVTIQDV